MYEYVESVPHGGQGVIMHNCTITTLEKNIIIIVCGS